MESTPSDRTTVGSRRSAARGQRRPAISWTRGPYYRDLIPELSSLSSLLARWRAAEITSLPTDVDVLATLGILDWVACALGAVAEPPVRILADEHASQPSTIGWARLLGTASRALDYDDISILVPHPSVAVLGAAIATAETVDASGDELAVAYVVGVEVATRVACAVHAENHYARGWDHTGTIGSFGAAAASAHLLRLDPSAWAHAIGIAGTMTSGFKASCGTMAHPLHAGNAAANGVLAARLAARGFTGNPDIVGAADGFAGTIDGREEDLEAVRALDATWAIRSSVHKAYASNGWTHGAISAALALRSELDVASVDRVDAYVSPQQLVLQPAAALGTPDSVVGRRSIELTTALALLGEDLADPALFVSERLHAPDIVELSRRIHVRSDDTVPVTHARLVAITRDGRERVAEGSLHQEQPPELEVRDAQITAKFRALVTPVLGTECAELEGAVRSRRSPGEINAALRRGLLGR